MNIYAPQRIWATVNGISTRLPSQCKQFIGGWSQDPTRPGATEYVRADLPNPLSAENAQLREALQKLEQMIVQWATDEGFPPENSACLKVVRQALGNYPVRE